MKTLLEIILGIKRGFLSGSGELSLQFNPIWPGQQFVGAAMWNVLLIAIAIMLVIYVYRREGRSRQVKVGLALIRAALIGLLILLLNRPVLTLTESRTEPSVLAVMVDDSVSMRVRDMPGASTQPASSAVASASRIEAVRRLLDDPDRSLLDELEKSHIVKLYRFDRDASPLQRKDLSGLAPDGQSTSLATSILSVLGDLQGQRLAGVLVLSDGRDAPARSLSEQIAAIRNFGVKVLAVPIGSQRSPSNVEIQSISVQESAFVGDIVNVKAAVRATGYEAGKLVKLMLKEKSSNLPLIGPDGKSAIMVVRLESDEPVNVEIPFKTATAGTMDLIVEAEKQAGEIDDADNIRAAQLSVLDAKISVLYVDGYPRWEYRYLKNQLIRDKTIDVSCLLTSADRDFAQEGDKPITRFPENIAEMMNYDVVLFGDVSPQQFTDAQLSLVSEFVAKKSGGFGMIAGPRFSPSAYRNTAIEAILPVLISRTAPEESIQVSEGFRPVLTKVGSESSVFRFFTDRAVNEKFLRNDLPLVYWYCRGVTLKSGVGEVYAEHERDIGPDGRKAPILVLGYFGGGRTLFSAIDDSWRWRFYTGESYFDTYWVQQIRYLARAKKLGQRLATLATVRSSYELGEQVNANLRVLDTQILGQLPEQIGVQIVDDAGQIVRSETMTRASGQVDTYTLSFSADRIGKFSLVVSNLAAGVDTIQTPVEVSMPRLELSQPTVDLASLGRLCSETMGQVIPLDNARQGILSIPSAARVVPIYATEPLWGAPLVMGLFMALITLEWVIRKSQGMV